jgi:hypothetical protein
VGRTFSDEDFAPAPAAAARVFEDDEFESAPAPGMYDDAPPPLGAPDPRLAGTATGGTARDVAARQLGESASDPDAVVRDTATGRGEAVGLGAAQGVTMGQAPRVAGLQSLMAGTGIQGLITGLAGERTGSTGLKEAGGVKRQVEEKLRKAEKDRPNYYVPAEVVASFAVPGAPKGAGLLRRVGQSAAEGALYAEGTGGDAATGAAVGGGITAGAGLVGKVVKKGATAVVDKLADRIVTEIGEQPGGTVGKKVRDRLVKFRDKVVDEVITGPDASTVRKAYRNPDAQKGLEQLKPVVDGLRDKLDEGYEAFRAAGKGTINAKTYERNLLAMADNPNLSAIESRSIKKLAADFAEEASRAAPDGAMDIQRLRQFTSRAQEAAAGAYGGDPSMASQAVKLKARLSAIASDAMDDWLDANAKGNPKLATAAKEIRENNRRISANLLVQGAIDSRAGQAKRDGLFKTLATTAGVAVGGTGAIQAVAQDPEKAAENAALPVAVGLGTTLAAFGVRRGARMAREAGTTAAINVARKAGGIPAAREGAKRVGKVAEQVTSALARRAGVAARRKATEEYAEEER